MENNNFEERYKEVLLKAEIIAPTPIKGCLALRSYGHGIWERIHFLVDAKIKGLSYENMSFPQFILKSQLQKQKEHYDSFIRETVMCGEAGTEKFEDKLIVRPTSECIIYPTIKDWIKTEKDLPLLLNQWCSIVRWEILKPNFPLIRDNEFLWQECHSAHADKQECDQFVEKNLALQKEFIEKELAIPVFVGRKPERRKFAGAEYTLALEAMMRNCKGIQIATSHSLGQKFSRVFDIKFADDFGKDKFVWQACCGMTTRLIGALAMMHSDENGLILPPRIAPYEIAVVDDKELYEKIKNIWKFRAVFGASREEWIIKGIPLIIENGIAQRRDTLAQSSEISKERLSILLRSVQETLFERALIFKKERTITTNSYKIFSKHILNQNGFCISRWCGDEECSGIIRKETKGSLRLINPLESEGKKCIKCGKDGKYIAVFGQSY